MTAEGDSHHNMRVMRPHATRPRLHTGGKVTAAAPPSSRATRVVRLTAYQQPAAKRRRTFHRPMPSIRRRPKRLATYARKSGSCHCWKRKLPTRTRFLRRQRKTTRSWTWSCWSPAPAGSRKTRPISGIPPSSLRPEHKRRRDVSRRTPLSWPCCGSKGNSPWRVATGPVQRLPGARCSSWWSSPPLGRRRSPSRGNRPRARHLRARHRWLGRRCDLHRIRRHSLRRLLRASLASRGPRRLVPRSCSSGLAAIQLAALDSGSVRASDADRAAGRRARLAGAERAGRARGSPRRAADRSGRAARRRRAS